MYEKMITHHPPKSSLWPANFMTQIANCQVDKLLGYVLFIPNKNHFVNCQ